MISILIADDHAMIREGLKRILESTKDLTVAGEAANGIEVLAALKVRQPDVLLLDLSMPGVSGFDLIKRVRADYAGLPILVLTMHDETQYALRAIRVGATGYLTKEGASTQLVDAIRKVAQGRPYFSSAVAEQLAMDAMPGHAAGASHDALSNRELQVLELIVAGKTVSDIAQRLNVSVKTVSTHKTRLLGKLRMHSVAELVRYAIEHGLTNEPLDKPAQTP
ncbi:MAG: response regulator transcription factor [Burkholderiaceae bacterium]